MCVSTGDLVHCAARSQSSDIISLFAFSSCLIKLLAKIFDTYSLLRYRQFLKCVSRIIRYCMVFYEGSQYWNFLNVFAILVTFTLKNTFIFDTSRSSMRRTPSKVLVPLQMMFCYIISFSLLFSGSASYKQVSYYKEFVYIFFFFSSFHYSS